MEVVTLTLLKAHLNVEPEDAEYDDLLSGNLAAAIRTVENRTGSTFEPGDLAIVEADLPAARQAVLLLAGHWFRNRETVVIGVTAVEVPMAVEYLITPLARMRV